MLLIGSLKREGKTKEASSTATNSVRGRLEGFCRDFSDGNHQNTNLTLSPKQVYLFLDFLWGFYNCCIPAEPVTGQCERMYEYY